MGRFAGYKKYANYIPSVSYGAEATALFARMSVQPSSSRKALINTLIENLKTAGIWSKLDILTIFAAHSEADGLINWVNSSFPWVAVSSPVFTTDRGFKGDGVAAYMTNVYNLSTSAVNYSQNDASVFLYIRQTADENVYDMRVNGTYDLAMKTNYSAGYFLSNVNDSSGVSYKATSNVGLGTYETKRNNSTARRQFHNGVQLGSDITDASGAPPSLTLGLMNQGSLRTTKEYSVFGIGGYLTDAQSLSLHNELETFLDAIGAGVIP